MDFILEVNKGCILLHTGFNTMYMYIQERCIQDVHVYRTYTCLQMIYRCSSHKTAVFIEGDTWDAFLPQLPEDVLLGK